MLAETPLWADVYNATWERIGDGPVPLISASVTRAFDGAGSIQFDAPASDERVIALLKNERRIKIMYNDPQTGKIRQLGSGIIRKRNRKYSAGSYIKTFSGPDVLDELKRRNTLLGRIYTNSPVGDVASSLAVLAGWQAETEPALDNLITARFDGTSILKALQTMTEQIGVHIREKVDVPSDLDHVIEVGHFGTDSGLYIMNPEMVTTRVYENENVAFIDSLTIVDESSEMFNWVIAIGSGEGESALTLEKATRSTPYARETTVVGGKTLYFKKNQTSINQYGIIQKVITFKDISPVGNSVAATGYAADMLDEATDTALDRNGEPQTVYRLTIKKGSKLIRAGDVVHINFRGLIRDKDEKEIDEETVEGDFYVVKVTENVSGSGVTLSLDISNIDKLPESEAAYVLSAIDELKLSNTKPALTNFRQSEGGEREMQQWDGTPNYITWATYELPIDETVTNVTLVLLRFSSLPMRSRNAYLGGTFQNTYMIADSNENPQDISLFLNGIDVTVALNGGFWNPYPANNTVDNVLLDITDYILNASGGIYQTHTIEFRLSQRTRPVEIPGYGSLNAVYGNMGIIRATITLMGTSQAIKTN